MILSPKMLKDLADSFGAITAKGLRVKAGTCAAQSILDEAQFLCDRLDSIEFNEADLMQGVNDFYGHVAPSHARLKELLKNERP